MEKFKTIEKEAEGVVIEKKSKFISNIFYIESEKEAEEILNKIRKKYHDARHHCYAYRIKTTNGIEQKQSDDGEPSGTAGAPPRCPKDRATPSGSPPARTAEAPCTPPRKS